MSGIYNKYINYCKEKSKEGVIPDLVKFGIENNIKPGHKFLDFKIDDNTTGIVYYAPAGNYPESPEVVICGVATSVKAKNYMENNTRDVTEEREIRKVCEKSVYIEQMATNLSLLLGILLKNYPPAAKIKFKNKNTGKYFINDLYSDSFYEQIFGTPGEIVEIPSSIQFTQCLPCLAEINKNGHEKTISSKPSRNWNIAIKQDLIKRDLAEGFLNSLLTTFFKKEYPKVLIFLGSSGNTGIGKVIKIIYRNIRGKSVEDRKIEKAGTLWKVNFKINGVKKLICCVHHPANTPFIYNNYTGGDRSLFYSYYENKGWKFEPNKYANVEKEKMEEYKEFYQSLQYDISSIL